jgi:hypothetical protein
MRDATWPKLIEPLTLSVRTESPLKRAGIRTLSELLLHSEDQLLRLPFLGRKGMRELEEELARHGHSLRVTPIRQPDADTSLKELQSRVAVLEAAVAWLVDQNKPNITRKPHHVDE